MRYISHRGNLHGSMPKLENTSNYIEKALNNDFDVEVDVILFEKSLFLGHDSPDELVNIKLLQNPHIWVHAKTIETLYKLLKLGGINCFFHNKDKCTLTNTGYIWTYPGCDITPLSIVIIHDFPGIFNKSAYGICSDNIANYRESK